MATEKLVIEFADNGFVITIMDTDGEVFMKVAEWPFQVIKKVLPYLKGGGSLTCLQYRSQSTGKLNTTGHFEEE